MASSRAPDVELRAVVTLEILHLYLGRWAFCVIWWLVLSCHVFIGGFAFSVTALHRYLQNEDVAQSLSALHVPKQTLQMTARVFFLVGFGHFIAIIRMIYKSCRVGYLAFPVKEETTGRPVARNVRGDLAVFYHCYDTVADAWAALFSPTGFFGFSSPYFETVFMCREAWEILMQTYQAYTLSQSVPRKWINQLAVTVIVLNCASSPLVHVLCRKNENLRRVLNLFLDAILDCCSSIIIPLCVIMPYVHAYNTKTKSFKIELLMNDVWFVNAISETRQVLVTSFPDFVSTIMPQFSLLGYLMTFKNILRRRSARVHVEPIRTAPVSVHIEGRLSEPSPTGPHIQDPAISNAIQRSKFASRHSIHIVRLMHRSPVNLKHGLSVLAHVLFVGWGLAVLGFHLDAFHNTDRHVPGCQLHVSAWHSFGFPCSVMLLNCHANQIDGSVNQTSAVLDLLERSTLQVLIFSHCTGLYISPVMTEFKNLAGIELFNCTLAEWSETALIHKASQPHVGYVNFVLTNWTSFPAGLLHDDLPAVLSHLSIIASNITNLPDTTMWEAHEWITLNFELLHNLQDLPDSFCRVRTDWLWLLGTGVKTLTSDCMGQITATTVGISGPVFERLPDTISPSVEVLLVEHSKLSQLPTWFTTWYPREPTKQAYFYASPVCNTSELVNNHELWSNVCADDTGTANGLYPWDIMLPLRPYNTEINAMPLP